MWNMYGVYAIKIQIFSVYLYSRTKNFLSLQKSIHSPYKGISVADPLYSPPLGCDKYNYFSTCLTGGYEYLIPTAFLNSLFPLYIKFIASLRIFEWHEYPQFSVFNTGDTNGIFSQAGISGLQKSSAYISADLSLFSYLSIVFFCL